MRRKIIINCSNQRRDSTGRMRLRRSASTELAITPRRRTCTVKSGLFISTEDSPPTRLIHRAPPQQRGCCDIWRSIRRWRAEPISTNAPCISIAAAFLCHVGRLTNRTRRASWRWLFSAVDNFFYCNITNDFAEAISLNADYPITFHHTIRYTNSELGFARGTK